MTERENNAAPNLHDFQVASVRMDAMASQVAFDLIDSESGDRYRLILDGANEAVATNWRSKNVVFTAEIFDGACGKPAFERAIALLEIAAGDVTTDRKVFYLDPSLGVEVASVFSSFRFEKLD